MLNRSRHGSCDLSGDTPVGRWPHSYTPSSVRLGEEPVGGQSAHLAGLSRFSGRPLLSGCIVLREPLVDLDGCRASLAALASEVVTLEPPNDDPPGTLPDLGILEAACSGEWILWLEPSETVVCSDPAGVSRTLEGLAGIDAMEIVVQELPVGNLGPIRRHHSLRLIRRRDQRRIEDVISTPLGRRAPFGLARLVRAGGLAGAFRSTEPDRRASLLEEAIEQGLAPHGSLDACMAVLGRALWQAGRPTEALACSRQASESGITDVRVFAVPDAVRIAIELGLTEEARFLTAHLRDSSGEPLPGCGALVARLEGEQALASHEPERALVLFDRAEALTRAEGGTPPGAQWQRAQALATLGRHAEAARMMMEELSRPLQPDTSSGVGTEPSANATPGLAFVIDTAETGGLDPAQIASQVHPTRLPSTLTEILLLKPSTADEILKALETRFSKGSNEHVSVLAAASMLATALDFDRAAIWSKKLRAMGLAQLCPLMAVARDQTFPGMDRVLAALTAHLATAEPLAVQALLEAAPACAETEVEECRSRVAASAPELLSQFDEARNAPLAVLHEREDDPRREIELSVVVLAYNRADATKACLESLGDTLEGFEPWEVVVLDNASTDATPSMLAHAASNVLALRSETNLGFARGCNRAAMHARGRVLVFMNNDIVALEGWWPPLASLMQSSSIGAAGAKLLAPDGTVLHAGDNLIERQMLLDAVHLGTGRDPADPSVSTRRGVTSVSGAALAIRREDFERLGGFDEGFWNAYEDVDLGLRIWSLGMEVVYEPSSVLVHHESATRGDVRMRSLRSSEIARRNLLRLNSRWLARLPEMIEKARQEPRKTASGFPADSVVRGPAIAYQELLMRDRLAPRAPRGRVTPKVSVVLTAAELRPSDLARVRALVAREQECSWELIVSSGRDPGGLDAALKEAHAEDERIAGELFCSPGAALEAARSSYVSFLEAGEELQPRALGALAAGLLRSPQAAFSYCDEDERHAHGQRVAPFMKPSWSPDLHMCLDYTSRLSMYDLELVRSLGVVGRSFDPSMRYRLSLAASEVRENPVHVREVLCTRLNPDAPMWHRGLERLPESRLRSDIDALEEVIRRRGISATVEPGRFEGSRRIRYRPTRPATVAVMLVGGSPEAARRCSGSLEAGTGTEVVQWMPVRWDASTGLARSMNQAISEMAAEVLLVVDARLVSASPGTLTELAAQAMREDIGAVGGEVIDARGVPVEEGVVLGVGGLGMACGRVLAPYLRAVTGERSALSHSCFAARIEVINEIGGFDEGFDGELCVVAACLALRARGYRILHTPYARFKLPDQCATGMFPRTRMVLDGVPVGVSRVYPANGDDAVRLLSIFGEEVLEDPYYHVSLSREVPFSLPGAW